MTTIKPNTNWKPFPLEALPERIADFIEVTSRSMQCDPAFVALPVLGTAASAIGATRVVEIKRGWNEPSILWMLNIGESGTVKTPAIRVAVRPLQSAQSKLLQTHARLTDAYEEATKAYDAWKADPEGDPPPEPAPPPQERTMIGDITIAAIGDVLRDNPRGVLLTRDELATWLGSFGRYGSSRTGDTAHWLSMHSGEPLIVDRKRQPTLHVERACVSIVGGIQPEPLRRGFSFEHIANGLAARFLMCYPPRRERRWSAREDIPPEVEAEYAAVIDRLRGLQPDEIDGRATPVAVCLDAEARERWAGFFDEHNAEQRTLTGALAAAWSKMEGGAARLALVSHFLRWATDEEVDEHTVDVRSMASGIVMVDWFKQQARSIYSMFNEDSETRARRELIDIIRRHGGKVSVRRWHRIRTHPTAEAALAELQKLADVGLGNLEYRPQAVRRGRPSLYFVLKGRRVLLKDRTTTD